MGKLTVVAVVSVAAILGLSTAASARIALNRIALNGELLNTTSIDASQLARGVSVSGIVLADGTALSFQ